MCVHKTERPKKNETRRGLCSRWKLQRYLFDDGDQSRKCSSKIIQFLRKVRCSAINKERSMVERPEFVVRTSAVMKEVVPIGGGVG